MTSSAIQQGMCPQRLARIDEFLKTRYIEPEHMLPQHNQEVVLDEGIELDKVGE